MEKTREIKKRIVSVAGTRKITKAMEMIASSKIKKVQDRLLEARAFIERVEDIITDIACYSTAVHEPLMVRHEETKAVLIVGITADRGLCGGYNSNIIRLIERTMEELGSEGLETKLDIIGTRGKNHFKYRSVKTERVFENLSDHPKFLDAREISIDILARYISYDVDRVVICYTKFINAAEHKPAALQILPIPVAEKLATEERKEHGIGKVKIGGRICRIIPEFIYDPSPKEILEGLLPQYIYTIMYGALLESTASETGARMTAMKSASESADDMLKDLNRRYHRARQQQITMEIAEIVSGAEALSEAMGG